MREGQKTMITIQSNVQHSLGQEAAVERIHQLVASLSERFPQQVHQVQLHLNEHCVDVDFAAYGYQVSWHAEIYDDQISLTGQIPKSAKKFEQKIEEAIVTRSEETLLPTPPITRVA